MNKRKSVLLGIFAAMILTVGGVVFYYWYNNTYFVSTEDAAVNCDYISISPKVSGKVIEFDKAEGDYVVKDQIIGRIEQGSLPDASIDSTLLRAPESGKILKKDVEPGEVVNAGATVAVMGEPQRSYITANIEETKIKRVKPGQTVDINVDEYGSRKFSGKIESLGQAANSAFSILPSSSGSTFTKVVQKIPVKIEVDEKDAEALLPGTNAVVKIHVR